jgi:catechol 2,3-dioxygenase-like lactoylglutathione lyase family enzyme
VERYGAWLSQTMIPKLLILGDPGAIIAGHTRDFCRTWPNQREVAVPGRHFLPEDSPHQIGAALAEFVTATRPGSKATQERTRPMKLSFTRIATRDVAKLAAFYRDIIGISPAGRDDYVEFATPTSGLAIVSQRAMDLQGANVTAPAANRSVILDFEVEDVDRERARLASIVSKFVLEPTNQPWGNRSMLFRDPDGNLINFFAPIDRAAHE